ncbi:NUDIX hydrolase [Paenibacillus antri]|uniref:NUDIX hydrolase n=1 Tax=Paenibacillus antri TaxID=2582848 RepID=A0A5R9G179_9BACL|nr:NUDIX hydrolase [Paenibacillus antri]TLS50097.1 NUDIX hydrolase [Paenibacillus antri]
MKATSVGVLITNGIVYLACHSTGNSFYDLPKGIMEPGESPIDVCCRETKEETGISLDPARLRDLGVFPYLRNKDLHLFLWVTDELPDPNRMVCTSFFEHPRSKRWIPEVDGYRYIPFEETNQWMAKSMAVVLMKILEKI